MLSRYEHETIVYMQFALALWVAKRDSANVLFSCSLSPLICKDDRQNLHPLSALLRFYLSFYFWEQNAPKNFGVEMFYALKMCWQMYYNKSHVNKCIPSDKLIVGVNYVYIFVYFTLYTVCIKIVFYTQKHVHLNKEALSIQENVWKVTYNANNFRNTLI